MENVWFYGGSSTDLFVEDGHFSGGLLFLLLWTGFRKMRLIFFGGHAR